MKIEITILLSFFSLLVAVVVAVVGLRRNHAADEREAAAEMTTVIVKLENIADGISEIKSDMKNVKIDVQELRERLVIVEQSTKSAHKRLDEMIGKDKPET